MRKLMAFAVVTTAVLLSGCGDQSFFGGTKQPDAYYEIDGFGSNPDIYEWTPASNPDYTCLALASGQHVQCSRHYSRNFLLS